MLLSNFCKPHTALLLKWCYLQCTLFTRSSLKLTSGCKYMNVSTCILLASTCITWIHKKVLWPLFKKGVSLYVTALTSLIMTNNLLQLGSSFPLRPSLLTPLEGAVRRKLTLFPILILWINYGLNRSLTLFDSNRWYVYSL